MGQTHGNDGTMYIGASVLAELRSYTLNEEAAVADSSKLGVVADTHIAGKFTTRWTGEATAWWDPTDTLGQAALTVGASVTLNFYNAGNTAGKSYKYGTATVMAVSEAVNRQGAVERTFRFQGNGALTIATV